MNTLVEKSVARFMYQLVRSFRAHGLLKVARSKGASYEESLAQTGGIMGMSRSSVLRHERQAVEALATMAAHGFSDPCIDFSPEFIQQITSTDLLGE